MSTYKLYRIFTNQNTTSGNTKIEKFRKFILAHRCQHLLLQTTNKKTIGQLLLTARPMKILPVVKTGTHLG